MALSDTTIRNAKPKEKQYKLHDEGGLFLLVRTTGGKLWRLKYRYNGKEQQLSFGKYPIIGLKEAREKRDDAKRLLAAGKDPSTEKKKAAMKSAATADNTFEIVAREFIEKRRKEKAAEATVIKMEWLVSILAPAIGRLPITEIDPPMMITALKPIEQKGHHETANRARSFASRVFRYAIASGRAIHDPAFSISDALIKPQAVSHAALIKPAEVGALLRAIDGYDGNLSTKLALKLLALVFVRPGELRFAAWDEFDFANSVWEIPARRMKGRLVHAVPLSRQALDVLQEASVIRAHSPYVFPGVRTWQRPLSENTLNAALRRLGYTTEEMVAHGFRSTASTLLNESGLWSPDAVERALAHKDANEVRGIYNRSPYWAERVAMAQWWGDYLDALRNGVQR
jgi:integrase